MKILLPIIVTLFLTVSNTYAQPDPPDPSEQPQNPPPVPITGIELLLIGGGAYGVSRLMKRKKG
jgi:hypothetical protein